MELKNFEIEVIDTLLTKHYETSDTEKKHNNKKWLGREFLQFTQTLTVREQEVCQSVNRVFEKLAEKFKLHH